MPCPYAHAEGEKDDEDKEDEEDYQDIAIPDSDLRDLPNFDIEGRPIPVPGQKPPSEPRMPVELPVPLSVPGRYPIRFPKPEVKPDEVPPVIPFPQPKPDVELPDVAASVRDTVTGFGMDRGIMQWPGAQPIPSGLRNGYDPNASGNGSGVERAKAFVMAQQLERRLPPALVGGATRVLDQAPSSWRQPGVQAGIATKFLADNKQDVRDMQLGGNQAFRSPIPDVQETQHPAPIQGPYHYQQPQSWWGDLFEPAWQIIATSVAAYTAYKLAQKYNPHQRPGRSSRGGGGKGALKNTLDLISMGSEAIGMSSPGGPKVDIQ